MDLSKIPQPISDGHYLSGFSSFKSWALVYMHCCQNLLLLLGAHGQPPSHLFLLVSKTPEYSVKSPGRGGEDPRVFAAWFVSNFSSLRCEEDHLPFLTHRIWECDCVTMDMNMPKRQLPSVTDSMCPLFTLENV